MASSNNLKCPVCRNQYLDEYIVDGFAVDQCPQCQGVWYDQGEYAKLVDVAMQGLKADPYGAASSRYCPRDGEKLIQMKYPQTMVQIDICPTCHGFWLDKRESDEIVQVRRHLRRVGKIQWHAPVTGLKGKLLRWIDLSLDELAEFDFLNE